MAAHGKQHKQGCPLSIESNLRLDFFMKGSAVIDIGYVHKSRVIFREAAKKSIFLVARNTKASSLPKESRKKFLFLVAWPTRGGGARAGPLKKLYQSSDGI